MKKRKWIGLATAIALIATLAFQVAAPQPVYAAKKMPNKLYQLVKGKVYQQASSGGYNVKFTKTKVKFYERDSKELAFSGKIKKVIKIKKGTYKNRYRIVFKNGNGTSSYISTDKKATAFDYYTGSKGYNGYSGSSSISLAD